MSGGSCSVASTVQTGPLPRLDELQGEGLFTEVKVIGVCDDKRLIAGERSGKKERVPRAFHLGLTNEEEGRLGRGDGVQLLLFSRGPKHAFQLHLTVEIVFDGLLPARGDEKYLGDSRSQELLHDEVDGGFRDQREHFLGDCLCHGKETRAVACCDNDAFHDGTV